MAKSSVILDWCIVRLGSDHNWWVDEVSDPVRWDVDGLSIVDPRQIAHLIELVEPLRDYGFDQELLEAAFIPFRIEKEAPKKCLRLKRVKDSFFESEEKLFGLPDILDEENGPYADLLDHLTRCRVKMLNDLFHFESKLTVDELEDELRESQNADFAEGKALHAHDELCGILDFMPAGYELEDGEETHRKGKAKDEDDIDEADLPQLDEAEEEQLKNDQSLEWDEDKEKDKEEDPSAAKLTPGKEPEVEEDWSEDEDEEEDEEDENEDDEDGGKKKPAKKSSSPPRGKRGKR
ncbi:MAG: hypothetical protein WCL04_06180 [Verrucomicrobiota bacterium]